MDEEKNYYYSNPTYQLEINLHRIRRELISMLDSCDETDCSECYQLKCKCAKDTKSVSEKGDISKKKSSNQEDLAAPPAATLPKPKWEALDDTDIAGSSTPKKKPQQNVKTWIDASSKFSDHTIVRETSSHSFNENLLLINKQKKTQVEIKYVNNGEAVEAFFKYFKVPSNTAVTYVSAKLAAACKNTAQPNYSYFQ